MNDQEIEALMQSKMRSLDRASEAWGQLDRLSKRLFRRPLDVYLDRKHSWDLTFEDVLASLDEASYEASKGRDPDRLI